MDIRLRVNVLKWSSRGGTVRLVDLQEQQLEDGLKYVEQLRADATDHEGDWGRIETSQPASLQSTLKDSWLVVEVRLNSSPIGPID
jgi:hypothetical protein